MEECSSDVVKMAEQGEETPLLFVVPNFDLVIVTTRNKQWLVRVKIDATNGT